jgi:3-deoxy-7-phosphoheptulonate synthase
VGDVAIGGDRLVVIAGPCAVEDRKRTLEIARVVRQNGAVLFRGGAFKPRTSPYAFQGLGEEGLRLLAAAREETGLAIVTEVLKPEDVDLVAGTADMLQIGARNMQNFALLKRAGEAKKPVLLKRGISSTIQEFLMAAEYILSEGNYDVVLCERGIRTFETATRFTMDLNAIPVVQRLSHLPIIVDPSHGTGHWEYVTALAKAGIACGADGLMIEVHMRPEIAFSDGVQSLKPEKFRELMRDIAPFAQAAGRRL